MHWPCDQLLKVNSSTGSVPEILAGFLLPRERQPHFCINQDSSEDVDLAADEEAGKKAGKLFPHKSGLIPCCAHYLWPLLVSGFDWTPFVTSQISVFGADHDEV